MEKNDTKWYAIYTRYKCEKLVMEKLNAKGITAFTPLTKKTKRYQRKIKHYYYPLIYNYSFVQIDLNDRLEVLAVDQVIDFIKIEGKPIPIPDEEIEILRKIVGEENPVMVQEKRLNVGEQVEIIHGNLTGLRGCLISCKNKHEIVVQLDAIGFDLIVSIDPSCVLLNQQVVM